MESKIALGLGDFLVTNSLKHLRSKCTVSLTQYLIKHIVDFIVYNMELTMSITFTKLFSSITESTIWSESSDIRVVWITMLAMADRRGRIWSSIPGLANRSQVTLEQTEIALQKFLSPDTYSRTKDLDGRRIEVIDGGWRLLNHEKYRSLRDDEERRIYKRDWIKNKRNVDNNVDNVDSSRPQYTKAEAEADTEAVRANISDTYVPIDTCAPAKTAGARKKFVKPTVYEVSEYCNERDNGINADQFVDHYDSNGWKVGKNPMKDWKATIRTWEQRNNEKGGQNGKNQYIDNSAPGKVKRAIAERKRREQQQCGDAERVDD